MNINIDETQLDNIFSLVGAGETSQLEKYLLSNTLPLTVPNGSGDTLLHVALGNKVGEEEMYKMVSVLVENGAPINKWNKFGVTPLHLAIKTMYPKVVKCLIEKGAKVDLQDTNKMTPIHYAAMSYFKQCYPNKRVEDLMPPMVVNPSDTTEASKVLLEYITKAENKTERDTQFQTLRDILITMNKLPFDVPKEYEFDPQYKFNRLMEHLAPALRTYEESYDFGAVLKQSEDILNMEFGKITKIVSQLEILLKSDLYKVIENIHKYYNELIVILYTHIHENITDEDLKGRINQLLLNLYDSFSIESRTLQLIGGTSQGASTSAAASADPGASTSAAADSDDTSNDLTSPGNRLASIVQGIQAKLKYKPQDVFQDYNIKKDNTEKVSKLLQLVDTAHASTSKGTYKESFISNYKKILGDEYKEPKQELSNTQLPDSRYCSSDSEYKVDIYEYKIWNYNDLDGKTAYFENFQSTDSCGKIKVLEDDDEDKKYDPTTYIKNDDKDLSHSCDSITDTYEVTHESIYHEIINLYFKYYYGYKNSVPVKNNSYNNFFRVISESDSDSKSDDTNLYKTHFTEFAANLEEVKNKLSYSDNNYIIKYTPKDNDKFVIIGDIHGSFHSFFRILFRLHYADILNLSTLEITKGYNIIFLGDIIDRGHHSIDICMILFKIIRKNKGNIFIIQGNHEADKVGGEYDRIEAEKEKLDDSIFSEATKESFIQEIRAVLKSCPLAIIINNIWLCHGGIPVRDKTFNIDGFIGNGNVKYQVINKKNAINDILWGDFTSHSLGENKEYFCNNDRDKFNNIEDDKEYIFITPLGVKNFMEKTNIKFIIRGHQDNYSNTLLFCNTNNCVLSNADYNTGDITHKMIYINRLTENIGNFITLHKDEKKQSPIATMQVVKNAAITNHILPVLTISTATDLGRSLVKDSFIILKSATDDSFDVVNKKTDKAGDPSTSKLVGGANEPFHDYLYEQVQKFITKSNQLTTKNKLQITNYQSLANVTAYVTLVYNKYLHIINQIYNKFDNTFINQNLVTIDSILRSDRNYNIYHIYIFNEMGKHKDIVADIKPINDRIQNLIDEYRKSCPIVIDAINNYYSLKLVKADDIIIRDATGLHNAILPSFNLPNIGKKVEYILIDPTVGIIGNNNKGGEVVEIDQEYYTGFDDTDHINKYIYFEDDPITEKTRTIKEITRTNSVNQNLTTNYSLILYNPESLFFVKHKIVHKYSKILETKKDIQDGLKAKLKPATNTEKEVIDTFIKMFIADLVNKQIEFFSENYVKGNQPVEINVKNDYTNFTNFYADFFVQQLKDTYPNFLTIKYGLPIMMPSQVSKIEDIKKDDDYIFFDTDYFKDYQLEFDCYNPNGKAIMETIMNQLRVQNVSPNQIDAKGKTPLFYAVEGYNIPIIELLRKNTQGIKEYKDKLGQTVIDVINKKIKSHMEYLIKDGDLVFTKRYWDNIKTELQENNVTKNNIPYYLDNIFNIAIIIQNLYWLNDDSVLKDNVSQIDFNNLKNRLRVKRKQYINQYKNTYIKGRETISILKKIRNKHLSSKSNLPNISILGLPSPPKPVPVPPQSRATANAAAKAIARAAIKKDKIIDTLEKIADICNQNYHAGYEVFWDYMIKNKIGNLLNDKTHIGLSKVNQDTTILTKLNSIVTFIEFQFYEDKTLEGNIYYGYLARLYTHLMAYIVGQNFYNAIELMVVKNITSTVRDQSIIDNLKEIKDYIVGKDDNHLAYQYVVRKMGYNSKSEDEVFDKINETLEKIGMTGDYQQYLLPYYRTLYRIVFEYLNRMMRNYHKFILNQYRGLQVFNLLN
jgi:hypothetical protein